MTNFENEGKHAFFSGLSANFWLIISALLVLTGFIFIYYELIKLRAIGIDGKTDGVAVFIALLTLIAAAVTIWVSWLIKEEAQGISENLIRENKEAIKSQIRENKEAMNFQMRLPILRSMVVSGYKWASITAKNVSKTWPDDEQGCEITLAKQAVELLALHKELSIPVVDAKEAQRVTESADFKSRFDRFMKLHAQFKMELYSLILMFVQWPDFKLFSQALVNLIGDERIVKQEIDSLLTSDDIASLRAWVVRYKTSPDLRSVIEDAENGDGVKNFKNIFVFLSSDTSEINNLTFALTVFSHIADGMRGA